MRGSRIARERRSRVLRTGAAVLVLVLCGCTSGGASPRPTTAPPIPPPPLTTLDTRRLSNVMTQPWSKAVVVDERTVDLHYYADATGCVVLGNVRRSEAATSVTLTLYVGHRPDAGTDSCIGPGRGARTRVPLDTPLGDRTLLDGGAVNGPEARPVERP